MISGGGPGTQYARRWTCRSVSWRQVWPGSVCCRSPIPGTHRCCAAFTTLINDHDPKPLYYQFQAQQLGQVAWEYVEQGPEVWRVRIGRHLDLATTPILELMTAYPRFKEILDGFGLYTCCGSHMNVVEAAADAGTDATPILEALRNAR